MGKNKNKNKQTSKKISGNTGSQGSNPRNRQAANGSAFTTAISSSGDLTLIPRPADVIRETPPRSRLGRKAPAKQAPTKSTTSEKRDSVITITWENLKQEKRQLPPFQLRPRQWWPCRSYRWLRDFVAALTRALVGPKWPDVCSTLVTACIFMFAAYSCLELVLSMVKGAFAQDTTADMNCSVVYVTVPGPIITISLINSSPSNPAHGTYYFSVVNGKTEWMNSITPPSQFSTLSTAAPEITPIISSVPITSPSAAASSPSNGLPSSPPNTGPTSGNTSQSTSANQPSSTPGFTSSTAISTPSLTSTGHSTSPISALPSPFSPTTSIMTRTVTSTAPNGAATTLTLISTTVIRSLPSASTSVPSSPTTSALPSTLTSTIPDGQTTTWTSTSTTIIDTSPSINPPSSISATVSNSPSIPTTIISGGSTSLTTSTAVITLSSSLAGPSPTTASLSTSSTLITTTSTMSVGSTTVLTRTSGSMMSPSSSITTSSPPSSATSRVLTTLTSTLPGGQITTIIIIPTATLSATFPLWTPPSSSQPSSSLMSVSSRSMSDGFTISLPKPSSSPRSITTTNTPSVRTSTTRITSGITTIQTMLSTTSVSVTASSPLSITSGGSSGLSSSISLASRTTSSAPSSSIFSWPASSTPSSTISGSLGTSSDPSSSPSSQASRSASTPTSSSGVSLSSLSSSTLTQSSGSSVSLSSSTFPSTSSVSSSQSLATLSNPVSTSTLILTSVLFTSSSSGPNAGAPSPGPSTVFTTLVPQWNSTTSSISRNSSSLTISRSSSSSSVSLTSSSLSRSSAAQSTSTSRSSSITGSSFSLSSLPSASSSSDGFMSIQTDTTAGMSAVRTSLNGTSFVAASTDTSLFGVRKLTTRVISYGDTAISFVFPTPDIMTTVSYWTGLYPTVTGPLPSDLEALPPTTRSTTLTPMSALPPLPSLPPLQIFSSKSRSFKTVITTIYEDGGSERRRVKREAAAQVLETLVTTPVVQPPTPTGAEMSGVEDPGPTSCGESGNFTLDFDDTTVSSSGDKIFAATGLRNPYHHLFYANGYTYVPDKWEPFPAISQPNVAMFLPLTGKLLMNQPFAGTLLAGEIGAGPRASVSAYWFNAYSGYFGCALDGVTPCLLRISGYRYDATLKEEVLVAEQNATIPACLGYIKCRLTQVLFNDQFYALSGIQFNAFTTGLKMPQAHMMDDLQMAWYNNTCSAGILRIGNR